MLGGSSGEVWKKDIQYWFIKGKLILAHFDTPRGAKITLALNEPKQVALHSNSSTNSENAPQVEKKLLIV